MVAALRLSAGLSAIWFLFSLVVVVRLDYTPFSLVQGRNEGTKVLVALSEHWRHVQLKVREIYYKERYWRMRS